MLGHSFVHALLVLTGLDQPHTQTTAEERAALVRFLRGAKTIVEIGVFEGATTSLLAKEADNDAKIYGIDPFFAGRFGICWGELIARHVTRSHRVAGRIIFVPKLSHEAKECVPDAIDFLFVDGDHSLEGITRDWETWAPRVKIGGILALHDSFPALNSKPTLGSQKFFAEVIARDQRFELVGQQCSLAILRRARA